MYLGLGERRQGGRRGCSGYKDESGCTWAWESVGKEVGEDALDVRTSRGVPGPRRQGCRRGCSGYKDKSGALGPGERRLGGRRGCSGHKDKSRWAWAASTRRSARLLRL
jgi:hypothetical protein